jgi:flagellar hook-associated protein 1 FlgK
MAVNSPINHGLEIGRRALRAQQTALSTTSQNIANANTPGYSRREANLETAVSGIQGGIGSGVDVASVVRKRSSFLDAQVRVEQQVLGRWEALEGALQGIEVVFNDLAGAGSSEAGTVFNEPTGIGLSGSLSRFWNAWQDLANVPESGAARAALRQEGEFLTNILHQYNARLRDAHAELDNGVVDEVEQINEILDQLAAVNREIPRANFEGGSAAGLEDRRDLLIERLSRKVDISIIERENGQVSVLLRIVDLTTFPFRGVDS